MRRRLEICKTELLHSCEDKETASKTEAATSSSPAQPASAATATPAAATNTDAAASPLTQLLDTWAPDSASMSEGLTIQLPAGCGDVGRPVQLAVPAALAPSAACPIAVVFGSQGDAAKQLGAYGAAAALHAAGARCLQGAAAAGDEEVGCLCVCVCMSVRHTRSACAMICTIRWCHCPHAPIHQMCVYVCICVTHRLLTL